MNGGTNGHTLQKMGNKTPGAESSLMSVQQMSRMNFLHPSYYHIEFIYTWYVNMDTVQDLITGVCKVAPFVHPKNTQV